MLRLLRFRPGFAAGLPEITTKNFAAAVFIYDLIIQTFCPNYTSPHQDKYFL